MPDDIQNQGELIDMGKRKCGEDVAQNRARSKEGASRVTRSIKRRPVLAYFFLTFVVSWSGVMGASFFMGMPAKSMEFEEIGTLALIPFLLGPIVVGLLLTGLVHGRAGYRELKARSLRWKMDTCWYAFAILTVPLLLSIILLVLSQFSSDYIPNIVNESGKFSLVLMGVIIGLIGGGIFEEMGWTGFVTPRLRVRYGILGTGLIIGTMWGAWHFLPVFWGCGDANGGMDWALFLPGFFFHYAGLIPFRILIVWLHERTDSVIPAILMHASLTANAFFILSIAQNGFPLFVYYLCFALALWTVVGVVLTTDSWKMVHHSRSWRDMIPLAIRSQI